VLREAYCLFRSTRLVVDSLGWNSLVQLICVSPVENISCYLLVTESIELYGKWSRLKEFSRAIIRMHMSIKQRTAKVKRTAV